MCACVRAGVCVRTVHACACACACVHACNSCKTNHFYMTSTDFVQTSHKTVHILSSQLIKVDSILIGECRTFLAHNKLTYLTWQRPVLRGARLKVLLCGFRLTGFAEQEGQGSVPWSAEVPALSKITNSWQNICIQNSLQNSVYILKPMQTF